MTADQQTTHRLERLKGRLAVSRGRKAEQLQVQIDAMEASLSPVPVRTPTTEVADDLIERLTNNEITIPADLSKRTIRKTVNILREIKDWVDPSDIQIHHHKDKKGVEYECSDLGCDLWFWNDPELKAAIPDRFYNWVQSKRDFTQLMPVLQLEMINKLNLLTGPIAKIGGHPIRLYKVLGIVIALLTSGVIGLNFDWIAGLLLGLK